MGEKRGTMPIVCKNREFIGLWVLACPLRRLVFGLDITRALKRNLMASGTIVYGAF